MEATYPVIGKRSEAEDRMERLDSVVGDETGLMIPAHQESFVAAGAEFLSRAFREFSSISEGNKVARIRSVSSCPGGSTGSKLFIEVDYPFPEEGVCQRLFVKFSRDFDDRIRDDRGKHEMRGETMFASASRIEGFPVVVPKVFFSDYNNETNTGIIITERIDFGNNGVEEHREKCMDHEIPDPYPYYATIIRSLARISGFSCAEGRREYFRDRFEHDPISAADEINLPFSSEELVEKIRLFSSFFHENRKLFPRFLDQRVFSRLASFAPKFVLHQRQLALFLQNDPRFIALCHWNANIDNAWFWRDEGGSLQCGLMDWGRAGRMNVAYSLWGCLSAAHIDIWRHHLDTLLHVYLEELHEFGGPSLSLDEIKQRFQIYVLTMGLSYFIDAPQRIRYRYPDFYKASGPYDSVFKAQATARNQLHISTNFLTLASGCDLDALLDTALARD